MVGIAVELVWTSKIVDKAQFIRYKVWIVFMRMPYAYVGMIAFISFMLCVRESCELFTFNECFYL